jgi:hypothetical protein
MYEAELTDLGSTPLEYIRALCQNEVAWTQSYAKPRMNYPRSLHIQEEPEEYLYLMDRYNNLGPFLIPSAAEAKHDILLSTLWHPDLHLNNIFVDPETKQITNIIDWQSAVIAPYFVQAPVPRCFRHPLPVPLDWSVPQLPDDYDSLDAEQKKNADVMRDSEICHKYYWHQLYKENPAKWEVVSYPSLSTLVKPIWLVTNAWANRDVFFFRQALIDIVEQWSGLHESSMGPCPISFTPQELELHQKEAENIEGIGGILKLFRDQSILPDDGRVDPTDYDEAKRQSETFKKLFLNMAENEEERALFDKVWPYQDSS